MRHDLLSLTVADLETLSNRGTVKRAQREIEAAVFTLDESAEGAIKVKWADGIECLLPAGVTLRDSRCTCAATTLCRHLVQSVLAYQRQTAASQTSVVVPAPWDPGQIADADLERLFSKSRLAAARARFQQGLLVELIRGVKPLARFEDEQCCLRFLVPGDARYVHCDCAEPTPCGHIPLAVWAFRTLAAEKEAGLVTIGYTDPAVPMDLFREIEDALTEACGWGISNLPTTWRDHVVRIEDHCREHGLVWPADILNEILQQFDAYHTHDARFSQEHVAELFGELLIRIDAIRAATGQVPQVWLRGSRSDRLSELGTGRFIGLGCGVKIERRRVRITAFLQDSDSGSLAAVEKEVADPPADSADPLRSFTQIGTAPNIGGVSLAMLGAGQLLTRTCKRSPAQRLVLPRGRVHVMPQSFTWEQLRAPLLAEDFAEIMSRLASSAPVSLRPRRLTEGLVVCPVAAVEGGRFHTAQQKVEACLRDTRGKSAVLRHPYTSRGRQGAESLLVLLTTQPAAIRFVAGHAVLGPDGLEIRPTCLVYQSDANRVGLQPWIGAEDAASAQDTASATTSSETAIQMLQGRWKAALAHALIVGLQRRGGAMRQSWRELVEVSGSCGLLRLKDRLASIADMLDRQSRQLHWDWRAASAHLLTLLALAKLGEDLGALA